jgi:4-hydroxy-tetrahydrodipicolinate synthase
MIAPTNFRGVIPILATPFLPDESLDLESLTRLVRFNVDVGVDAVTVLGLLGESNRLTDAERARVVETAVAAAGGTPVIAGTSHPGTAATIALSREAILLGAAAVMITPAAQGTPSDDAISTYFQRIAERLNAPIVLQDHPAISQVHMSVPLILRMVQEIPTISAIKAEAVPSPARIAALKRGLTDRHVTVLTGLGGLYGMFDLERGSDGFNTGFAFPEVLIAIMRAWGGGDVKRARALYNEFLPLIVFEQQPGVAIRKEVLRRRGLITSSRVRHPGASIDRGTCEQLIALLAATFGDASIDRPLAVAA